MTTSAKDGVRIGSYLREPLTVGEPDVSGSMAIYPVFGTEPQQDYISTSRAQALGFTVKEQAGGGSVRDVIVSNPTDHAVLIYEGEEVLGGQQNRTFDKSILIGPGEGLPVPVSCVEAGRWDGSRNRENFQPSPQTADPKLRRLKAQAAHRARQAGMDERADQGQVWSTISEDQVRLGVRSPTGASNQSYDSHRDRLRARASQVKLRDGQIGTVFQICGRVLTLDLVSRPEVFADLHAPLVQGYCLDALGASEAARVDGTVKADRFLRRVSGNRIFENDGIGLGRGFRFENHRAVGSGLVSGEELIQLSVFTNRPDRDERPINTAYQGTRINRPSRRHP